MKSYKLLVSSVLFLSVLTGCQTNHTANTNTTQNSHTPTKISQPITDLPTFNSCQAIQKTLKNHFSEQQQSRPMYKTFAPALELNDASTAELASSKAESNPSRVSKTNVQEAGVDEADIVKNDRQHIYVIRNNTIRIINTQNKTLEEVANFSVEKENFWPRELYVDQNTLTVVGTYQEPITPIETPKEPWVEDIVSSVVSSAQAKIAPDFGPYYPTNKTMTSVITFDITNKSAPKQTRMVSVEGNYTNSRKINEVVYIITNKYQNNYWHRPMPIVPFAMPAFTDSAFAKETVVGNCETLHYVPHFETPDYLIMAAIHTTDTTQKVGRKMVLGSGNKVYASAKNLYVTRNKYGHWYQAEAEPKTEIYKFGLNGTDINFSGKTEVVGTVLNQFSMSENREGFFRIATQENQKGSRVTIFNPSLQQTGYVGNIAPTENLKSARFMGNKGYLVTFKNVDPLFVIDLNPTNPKVLGKLKIPGWSDYLHPYKDGYLIGIGKEVSPEAETKKRLTSADVLGVKLSIFDVRDVQNPKEIWKTIIGEQGSYTDALQNHKSFLFDATENVLALPITINVKNGPKQKHWQPNKTVFKGAHVYDVSIDKGFVLRGTATHYPTNYWQNKTRTQYGNYEFDIERILFMGNYFYTVSANIVASYDWNTLKKHAQIQLDTKACPEIYDAMECQLNPQCSTVQKEWEECTINNKTFTKTCTPKTDFMRCETSQK